MCRAFLSPWYERGGETPADENDVPVFIGRWNAGAISLNLPLILAKSREENKDFFEVLDIYLEKIRELHQRTFEYLAEMPASINPLAFCEGGFYKGNLKPHEKIAPLLKYATASFGFTALNELQQLYNQKSITEDGQFALDVMKHINDKINQFKKEDHILYAIYGTPAESLCFSGDTEVHTSSGYVKIKDIREGDSVYTYNEESKEIELKKVVNSSMTMPIAKVVNVKTTDGHTFTCTVNHPFAVVNTIQKDEISYILAAGLETGMKLKTDTGEDIRVESVEFPDEAIPVYNITVEDNHNYFVGSEDGILVHNCGLQVKQFRNKYGIVKNVSDRAYVSNSFHCHVSEEIDCMTKQDLEGRFWDLANGGKIQYTRHPTQYNFEAMKQDTLRAMKLGYYKGHNMALSKCDDCGYEQLDMDTCPKCGSSNLTKIDRMNGYLSYSRVHGDTRLNDAKMEEIKDRVSM